MKRIKRVLFVFWHGLGDNILATPAIRKYKQTTGNFVGWAMLRRFKAAELFKQHPCVDQVHWVSDAWNDFGPYAKGRVAVTKEAKALAVKHDYDELKIIMHQDRGSHKIPGTAAEMGVMLGSDVHTEVYYNTTEVRALVKAASLPDEYVFFHGSTGLPKKDLPRTAAEAWLHRRGVDLPLVSPDFTWDHTKMPISFALEVMRGAKHIVVVDSVMYHAAHAMDLKVDLAYFARGLSVWKRVHPLHVAKETISYNLDAIKCGLL